MTDEIEDRPALDPNSAIDKKRRREHLRCTYCPPNKGENKTRTPKHGVTKPKKKDHR